MERKKVLTIDAGICDATAVREETLQAYDEIQINAATVITSEKSKQLMANHRVLIRAGNTLDAPEGAVVTVQNGQHAITGNEGLKAPTVLIVNGSLTIGPDTQDALASYAAIVVNGTLMHPESVTASLANLTINGETIVYPDDAIVLKNTFTVDKIFGMRARSALYFAADSVLITDPDLNVKALVEKGVRFQTPKAIIAEAYAETLLPIFADSVEIDLVPQGFSYVGGNLELTDELVNRYGPRLYVDGDLRIRFDSTEALQAIEALRVCRDIHIPDHMRADFRRISASYRELISYRGTLLSGKGTITVDASLLELYPQGLTLQDCGIVSIDAELAVDTIRDKLTFTGCGVVVCTVAQKSAVESVALDVGVIRVEKDAPKGSLSGHDDLLSPDSKTVQAASYRL